MHVVGDLVHAARGIVDEAGDAAEAIGGLADNPLAVRLVRHAAVGQKDSVAKSALFGLQLQIGKQIPAFRKIDSADARPAIEQTQRHHAAEPPGRTRHDDHRFRQVDRFAHSSPRTQRVEMNDRLGTVGAQRVGR